MSQHALTPDRSDVEMILIGWDPRLCTFYARVVPTADAAEDAPSLWMGQSWGEFPDPQPLLARVAPYTSIPAELAQTLLAESHPSHRR